MFITALFTTVKIRRQAKCLSIDEWIEKMWHIYTMKYYSSTRKQDILPFATTWMVLEHVMLSETNQTERQVLSDITYMWNLKKLNP